MEYTTSGQSFAFELKGNSAIILRCFSRASKAIIPEKIGQYTVTEVAPYAFSAHMDQKTLFQKIENGQAFLALSALEDPGAKPEALTPLCGNALEEIYLPLNTKRVGRYCFYNCENLRSMEFCDSLEDWGSGVFTGCHHVNRLRVHHLDGERSYLKNVLDELVEEMEVTYLERKTLKDENGYWMYAKDSRDRIMSQVLFPEFFEEGTENTPARLLSQTIHGSGAMYRNCFHNRILDLTQYDTVFPSAKPIESFRVMGRLAVIRLRYPDSLSESARVQYETYLDENEEQMVDWLLMQPDLELLQWYVEYHRKSVPGKQEGFLSKLITAGARKENPQLTSFLMHERRKLSVTQENGNSQAQDIGGKRGSKSGSRRKRLEF